MDWTQRSSSGDKMSFGGLWRTCSLNLGGTTRGSKSGGHRSRRSRDWERRGFGRGREGGEVFPGTKWNGIPHKGIFSPRAFSIRTFWRRGRFPQEYFTAASVFRRDILPPGKFYHRGCFPRGDIVPPWCFPQRYFAAAGVIFHGDVLPPRYFPERLFPAPGVTLSGAILLSQVFSAGIFCRRG